MRLWYNESWSWTQLRGGDLVRFVVTIDRDEDGVLVVECPAIPGCVSQGTTKEQALANVEARSGPACKCDRNEGCH